MRGEIVMSKAEFGRLTAEPASADSVAATSRNAVAGMLRRIYISGIVFLFV